MTIIIAFSTFSNIFLQSFYIDIIDNHLLQVSVLSFCFLISLLRFYNGDQIPEFYKFCIMVQEKILLKCFKRDLNAIFYWKLKAEKNHIMWEGNVQIDQESSNEFWWYHAERLKMCMSHRRQSEKIAWELKDLRK